MADPAEVRRAVEELCAALDLPTTDLTEIHIEPHGVRVEWLLRDDDGYAIVYGDSLARRGEFFPMSDPVESSRPSCDGEHVHWCMTPAADEDSDPRHWPGDAGAVIEATADERAADVVNAMLSSASASIGRALGVDLEPPSVTADYIREWKAKQ